MSASICTLFEKDYQYGLGVLLNSLYVNGFRGNVWVGYRGDLPPWFNLTHSSVKNYTDFIPSKDFSIRFIELDTNSHFTNFKPDFMLHIFQELDTNCESLYYIDPDIVIDCQWSWMSKWCSTGPVMCADVNWCLPHNYPIRSDWEELILNQGFNVFRSLDFYLNGGFIGIHRKHIRFLNTWMHFLKIALKNQITIPSTGDICSWRIEGRNNPFHTPDQDSLNVTAMIWDGPLSILGPDAMGFTSGINLIPHAIGPSKPWRRRYLLDAILAKPPNLVDKLFWLHTREPIRVYSNVIIVFKIICIKIASFIGRFYIQR